jgi:hypothetical protein
MKDGIQNVSSGAGATEILEQLNAMAEPPWRSPPYVILAFDEGMKS